MLFSKGWGISLTSQSSGLSLQLCGSEFCCCWLKFPGQESFGWRWSLAGILRRIWERWLRLTCWLRNFWLEKAREQEAHGWILGFGSAERGNFWSGSWFVMVRPAPLTILLLTVQDLLTTRCALPVHFPTPFLSLHLLQKSRKPVSRTFSTYCPD